MANTLNIATCKVKQLFMYIHNLNFDIFKIFTQ